MKNGVDDVNTDGKGKKGKKAGPAKARKTMKELTKPTQKAAKSKGRAAAIQAPMDAPSGNGNASLSLKRAKPIIETSEKNKITSTQKKKPTEALRIKQENAKPMPTKTAVDALPKDPASNPGKGLKKKASANDSIQNSILHRPGGKQADDDDDAMWDVDQAHMDEEPQTLKQSRRPPETVKERDARAMKPGKNKTVTQLQSDKAKPKKPPRAKDQGSAARIVTGKPPPAASSQPRSRRAAAIKANKKIQGLEELDEIVDDDELLPKTAPGKANTHLVTANMLKEQKVRDSGDNLTSIRRKPSAANFSKKNIVPVSISPDTADKQVIDSVLESRAASSPRIVGLVKDVLQEALRAVAYGKEEKTPKMSLIDPARVATKAIHLEHSDVPNQQDSTSAEPGAQPAENDTDVIPDSVAPQSESTTETELAPLGHEQEHKFEQQVNTLNATMPGGVDNEAQDEVVFVCNNGESLKLDSKREKAEREVAYPQVPTIPTNVEGRERRRSPRLAEAVAKASVTSKVLMTDKIGERRKSPRLAEAAKKPFVPLPTPIAPMTVKVLERRVSPRLAEAANRSSLESNPPRRDPFAARLKASIPQLHETHTKFKKKEDIGDVSGQGKRRKGPNSPELDRALLESKAAALNTPGLVSPREAKRTENARRNLKSTLLLDGEGKNSLRPSLKPVDEPATASGATSKRKVEQVGDTSNKRVKMALHERLEAASAKRKPAHNLKNTPPPVVSNKPLMIGFSSTGPRNQGTASTNKPKCTDVGIGAPDAAEVHKHELANPINRRVEAGLALVQGAVKMPPKYIKHNHEMTGDSQNKRRGPPQQNYAEHIEAVMDVVDVAEKRKFAPFLDEPAAWEHERHPKRQKREMKTPPITQIPRPQMLPDINPTCVHDGSQRLSSQNTRVNENGSPMPFFIARNENTAPEEQYSDEDDGKHALAEARLEEQLALQDGDPISLSGPLVSLTPPIPNVSIPQSKHRAYQGLPNNSKHVPSSPHAPSALSAIPPHHLYDDGEIVNVVTNEAIVSITPQDPFLGATQKPQNSFMEALRKATEFVAKHFVPGASDNKNSGGVEMQKPPDVGDDPDETLVDQALKKKYKLVLVSDSSSSSQSDSSTNASQADDFPEENNDEEAKEAIWRKGLEPHQDNVFECLLNISHVSINLAIRPAGH